jgi:hypothetical protein
MIDPQMAAVRQDDFDLISLTWPSYRRAPFTMRQMAGLWISRGLVANICTGINVAVGGAANRPSRTCRRQVNSNPGYTPCRAATSVTRAPTSSVSATIRSFSSIGQRRRRSRPVMISIVPLLTGLKLRLMHSFKVNSVRHSTFEPEGVADRTLTVSVPPRSDRRICQVPPRLRCSVVSNAV